MFERQTEEEREINALPDELRQVMACYVLAGWRFVRGTYLWRAYMPEGLYYSVNTLAGVLEETRRYFPDPTDYRDGKNKLEEGSILARQPDQLP